MANFTADKGFVTFRDSLESILKQMISTKNTSKKDFDEYQKGLVEKLVESERSFKSALQRHYWGKRAYNAFLDFILVEQRNILVARTFFRERQVNFDAEISNAIKTRNLEKMYKFDINYTFIKFILDRVPWKKSSKMFDLAEDVKRYREELIIQNLPLAISRATIFRAKTPEGHLSFMDMQSIAAEALINSVDKFVLPYRSAFRDVIIGRVTGDLIADYSSTQVHFYPPEKKKIYRARKAAKLREPEEFDKIAMEVNSGHKTVSDSTGTEIMHLMAACSPMSIDTKINEEDGDELFSSVIPDSDDKRPDIIVEKRERAHLLAEAVKRLSVFEVKLLKLKGLL
jgi:DNA-directed RNA polymerase specialized sigma subunit